MSANFWPEELSNPNSFAEAQSQCPLLAQSRHAACADECGVRASRQRTRPQKRRNKAGKNTRSTLHGMLDSAQHDRAAPEFGGTLISLLEVGRVENAADLPRRIIRCTLELTR